MQYNSSHPLKNQHAKLAALFRKEVIGPSLEYVFSINHHLPQTSYQERAAITESLTDEAVIMVGHLHFSLFGD